MSRIIDLIYLRTVLAVRLAVAPRHLFRTLAMRSTPDANDRARDELVGFVTQGWDGLDLSGELADPVAHDAGAAER
jgi:hypothetical protein